MTQKKNSYEQNDLGVIMAAVMVAALFIAGMVYNKNNFKKHKMQRIERQQTTIKPASKDIKTFVAKDLFKQITR